MVDMFCHILPFNHNGEKMVKCQINYCLYNILLCQNLNRFAYAVFGFGLVWLDLILHVPVNSHGHVGMVSSPNHTFFLGKLDQGVNQYLVHILSFVTDNNPS